MPGTSNFFYWQEGASRRGPDMGLQEASLYISQGHSWPYRKFRNSRVHCAPPFVICRSNHSRWRFEFSFFSVLSISWYVLLFSFLNSMKSDRFTNDSFGIHEFLFLMRFYLGFPGCWDGPFPSSKRDRITLGFWFAVSIYYRCASRFTNMDWTNLCCSFMILFSALRSRNKDYLNRFRVLFCAFDMALMVVLGFGRIFVSAVRFDLLRLLW